MKKLAATLMTFCLTGLVTAQAAPQAYLGVGTSEVDPSLAEHLGLPAGVGLTVEHVDPEGAAANKVNAKDVLHKLDDQVLINHQQLAVLVRSYKPGDEVKLTVISKGQSKELSTTLLEKDLPPMGSRSLPNWADGNSSIQIQPPVIHAFPFGGDPGSMNDLQEQIQKKMEEAMTKLDGLPFNGDDLRAQFEDQFEVLRNALQGNAGVPQTFSRHQNSSKSKVQISEGDVTITVTEEDGSKHVKAEKKDGTVLFDGPCNSDDELSKMPDDVRKLYDTVKVTTTSSFFGTGPKVNSSISIIEPKQHSASSSLSVKAFARDGISVTITTKDGKQSDVQAVDREGHVIYEGPYNTDVEKEAVPKEVRDVIDQKPRKRKKQIQPEPKGIVL